VVANFVYTFEETRCEDMKRIQLAVDEIMLWLVSCEHDEGSVDSMNLAISFSSRILLNSTDKNLKHEKQRNNINND
jgi:hypothetical protein